MEKTLDELIADSTAIKCSCCGLWTVTDGEDVLVGGIKADTEFEAKEFAYGICCMVIEELEQEEYLMKNN